MTTLVFKFEKTFRTYGEKSFMGNTPEELARLMRDQVNQGRCLNNGFELQIGGPYALSKDENRKFFEAYWGRSETN